MKILVATVSLEPQEYSGLATAAGFGPQGPRSSNYESVKSFAVLQRVGE